MTKESLEYKVPSFRTKFVTLFLQNTRILPLVYYILGIAVYTGKDTKMAKNQKEKTHKFSTVERYSFYSFLQS